MKRRDFTKSSLVLGMVNMDIDEIFKYLADREGIREHAVGHTGGVEDDHPGAGQFYSSPMISSKRLNRIVYMF